jgi:hypothetical protein
MADDWIDLRRRDGVTLRVMHAPPWSVSPLATVTVHVGYPSYLEVLPHEQQIKFIFSLRYYGRWLAYDTPEQK